MMADFLFVRFVAVAFLGTAFGSSGVCLSDDSGDLLRVDAAGDH